MNGNHAPEKDFKDSIQCNGSIETKAEETEAPVTREITQTDHLNRKLLESFLTRINSTDLGQMVGRANIQDEPSLDFEDNVEREQDSPADVSNCSENQQVKE